MSKDIVTAAKADLVAAGHDLSGNDGAFLITIEAASRISGAGVVDKPNGNHALYKGKFYSVDGIMFTDGRFFDALIDGGGKNEPTWHHADTIDPGRWRPAESVLTAKPPPVDNPDKETLDKLGPDVRASLGRIEASLGRLEQVLETVSKAIRVELKPNATGGWTAYVKFDLKPVKEP